MKLFLCYSNKKNYELRNAKQNNGWKNRHFFIFIFKALSAKIPSRHRIYCLTKVYSKIFRQVCKIFPIENSNCFLALSLPQKERKKKKTYCNYSIGVIMIRVTSSLVCYGKQWMPNLKIKGKKSELPCMRQRRRGS